MAWERLPQRRNYVAQQRVAAAQNLAGSALFPDAPTATGSYINDNIAGSADDFITTQVEVSTPVWLPGEGTATQNLARARAAAAEAGARSAHLGLATEVLDLATQAALAVDQRDVAAERLKTARALSVDAANRFHAGEGPESDLLAAEADAATARISLSDAEAHVGTAVAALLPVVGTTTIPRLCGGAPMFPPGPQGLDSQPQVAAAQQAVEAARANLRLTRIQNRNDPEIGLEGINEKQPGSPWDTRVGVVVHFSFATEARNAPRRAAAEAQLTQAEVALELARRQVLTQYRQAQAMLANAEANRQDADRAAADQARRRAMLEQSWKLGEMPLIEVIRADALAADAALTQARNRTLLASARLRADIAQGAIP
jgi:cobalt-zinc-cadmium efflux system outer membrane protein